MLVSREWDAAITGVFGLLFGSFLNVVIHRYPFLMLRQSWADAAWDVLDNEDEHRKVFGKERPASLVAEAKRLDAELQALPELSLSKPRSRCPSCGCAIHWYQNIPVVSWLALRGRCAGCGARISPRYPAVELFTGLMFAVAAWHFGLGFAGAAWAAFAAFLIALFFIDFDTMYLPDALTYPLLWLGLLVALLGWTIPLRSAVLGAAAGYLVLWLVYHAFRILTGKHGMGYGDFKLLAALGAWFGHEYLLAILLLSSLVGSVVGGALIVAGRLKNKDIPIPFGPFLAGAGLLAMALGPGRLEQMAPFAFPLSNLAR